MSSKWRRFEVLLPIRLNDGQPVADETLAEAISEIVARFGSVSYETQRIEGQWRHAGKTYRDDLVRIVIDTIDVPANRTWMKKFKSRWMEKLEQIDLWLVSYRIEVD